MIPYDDLVVALAAWRGRQGLPVAQPAGAPPRAPAPPPPAARAAPPARTTSPKAAVAPPKPAVAPKPAPTPVSHELQDFDEGEGALGGDGTYDPGDDYAVPFGGAAADPAGEATAIGAAPTPPEGVLQPKRGKRNPDW